MPVERRKAPNMDNNSVGGLVAVLIVMAVLWLAGMALVVFATVTIVRKAGYSGWWVLMGCIPLAGFVMWMVFAFSRWPVLEEAERARLAYPQPQSAHPPNRRR